MGLDKASAQLWLLLLCLPDCVECGLAEPVVVFCAVSMVSDCQGLRLSGGGGGDGGEGVSGQIMGEEYADLLPGL
eukprot:scaffold233580_cov19-Prasinocladus_malaysianus.AAC.1